MRSIDTNQYHIDFQPMSRREGMFNSFILAIQNRSGTDIRIDWNKSRYLFNGKGQGVFLFEGITEKNIQDIPADVIPPGASLSRELWPAGLLAIAPIRSPTVGVGERGFSGGALPPGENGILLVMTIGGNIIRQPVSVMISTDKP